MKKAVIFDATRRAALETYLPDAAAKVSAAGDAVRASSGADLEHPICLGALL